MQGRVCQLLLVNALTCGLEVCMAAGTFYIPPLLLQAGMEERYMTMVLGVGPVLGLIFVPMIGLYSDSWRGRFGRRRPFIWLLCVGILLGLQVMPQASHLAALLYPQHPRWLERVLLAGSACLLEFSGQACFTPLEALISDQFPGEEESRRAFSVYSLMISLGGCLGYLLPALDWSHAPTAAYLGGQEAFIYALLTLIFLTCLLSTVFISEERYTRGGETTRKDLSVSSALSRYCAHSLLPRPQCVRLAVGRSVSLCVSALPRMYSVCMHVPAVIRRLFVAELFSWMALMSFMLFYTDFMGVGLYRGVPNATPGTQERLRYDEGVRMASVGLFLQCLTSVVCSILMERWIVLLGTRAVYVSSVVLLALATAVMSFSKSVVMITVMAAATGYTFCVLQVLPYTLLCLYHSDRQVFFSSSKSRPSHPGDSDDHIHSKPLVPPDSVHIHGNRYPEGVNLPGAPLLSSSSPHVSLPLERGEPIPLPSPLEREGEPIPLPHRGMCLDMAILDSAYLLSQVLPALCLGSIVQQSHSVSAYMASACSLSIMAMLCSTCVVFTRSDLHKLTGSKDSAPTLTGLKS
ncbi:solute carrier family 45 member 3 [Oncorhynchus tshawytscha]|uniref:Solute carrier family 45 member 3 n=1 Tax=Oncorhynchus tshawytscha TaxID=74940 RepID=A0A8C8CA03_ONCTS|nr:solute carrier family 45 member 3 [Oncorhynchus tshawytscha]XP_024282981.1 solute carrier family 45 member 3 [Oncorhynchus tshawytscha]XP_024282982.1 solute carrier family 45 member 3 [Oncorhynchus tshawytscha]XP_024282983.1 solute carrier family 45 member 3 [Oncorhynchus tshawytscha]